MNPYSVIMPRLEGKDIEKDFERYEGLVKKGVLGFIVFGGGLETLREGIRRLQAMAPAPLIIASDLEQGLGGQVEGGTTFPPAMAMTSALGNGAGPSEIRRAFGAIAGEALYAGINTVFAPVLDINTNPLNPIISTRAFGEDPETVSRMGAMMIKILQRKGVNACGKHFPGHGDTHVDSHIGLPYLDKGIKGLASCELIPFERAIAAGVRLIMAGHISSKAFGPPGAPASVSGEALKYLRKNMGFRGLIITDAMNMGALGKFGEEKASLMALRAGADIVLHPSDPERAADYIKRHAPSRFAEKRLETFRKTFCARKIVKRPDFIKNKELSSLLSSKALSIEGNIRINKPFIIILDDDDGENGSKFAEEAGLRGMPHRHVTVRGFIRPDAFKMKGKDIVCAVFSSVKAWKGGPSKALINALRSLDGPSSVFVSFGSPHLLDGLKGAKLYAYWGSEAARRAALEEVLRYII